MKLTWSLFTRNIRPHAQLRLKLQQKVNKIEKHLEGYGEDEVHLKVSLERHPRKYWFTAAIALKLPTGTVRAAKFSDDPLTAFEQAVRTLLREMASRKSAPKRAAAARPQAAAKAPVSAAIADAALRAPTRQSPQASV